MTFPFVPGTEVEIQDGGLRVDAPAASPTVLIMGYTDNTGVAKQTPIRLETKNQRFTFLNADGSTNKLVRAITEAFDGGAQNIEVFVLGSGSQPAAATGVYAELDTAYNLLINHTPLDVIRPAVDVAVIDATGLASTQNFAYQLADFCYKSTVNRSSAIGVIGTTGPANAAGPTGVPTLAEQAAWVDALNAFDTSGISGVAFDIYDGVSVANPQDVLPSTYAFWATDDSNIPVGTPPSSDGNVIKDQRGNPVDIGAYISVFASYVRFFNDVAAQVDPNLGYYDESGASAYAGLIVSLQEHTAPTNQALGGTTRLRELSLTQANTLSQNRFVTVITRSRGLTVTSAMTGAYNIDNLFRRSDFVRLSTVRVVHAAVDILRTAGDPFIGKASNAVNKNALESALNESLRSMLGTALEDFSLAVTVTTAERVIGQITVSIDLQVALEIQRIKGVVSVR